MRLKTSGLKIVWVLWWAQWHWGRCWLSLFIINPASADSIPFQHSNTL